MYDDFEDLLGSATIENTPASLPIELDERRMPQVAFAR